MEVEKGRQDGDSGPAHTVVEHLPHNRPLLLVYEVDGDLHFGVSFTEPGHHGLECDRAGMVAPPGIPLSLYAVNDSLDGLRLFHGHAVASHQLISLGRPLDMRKVQ